MNRHKSKQPSTRRRSLIQLLLAFTAALAFNATAHADIGFFGSYIQIGEGSSTVAYNLSGRDGSPLADFDTVALGIFNVGGTLYMPLAEGLTFHGVSEHVFGSTLNYSIDVAGGAHGSFTGIELLPEGNAQDLPADLAGVEFTGDLNGKYIWRGLTPPTVNVLDGLGAGDYELQVFLSGTGSLTQNGPTLNFFHNNGGGNYTATFTVVAVPEPSLFALLWGVVGLGAITRRRRS